MNAKIIIGGFLGGVTLFVLGWLIYGKLLADTMGGGPCMRAQEDMNVLMIGLGNLFSGLLLAYIFSRWATISTFVGGATAGAVIGLLMAAGFDCVMYGTTTMVSSPGFMIMDIVVSALMTAIAGGVVGWWLGRK